MDDTGCESVKNDVACISVTEDKRLFGSSCECAICREVYSTGCSCRDRSSWSTACNIGECELCTCCCVTTKQQILSTNSFDNTAVCLFKWRTTICYTKNS